jgi:aminoglycoside phosphotransferase family enzyme/predicted kinase
MTAADAHAQMLAQLRRPGACAGHPEAAGLVQTHISSLLLAGDQVFKLKRPVALGFVDFSSIGKRHAACLEELRLNQRTAAHWYQAVVPVLDDGSGARIAAPDEVAPARSAGPAGQVVQVVQVVDWAVQMRRFDDRLLYSRLAADGRLTPAQVDALGAAVAGFHNSLPPSPPGFGDAQALQAMVARNLQELAALLAAPPWQGQPGAADAAASLAGLQAWSAGRGRALAPLMGARRMAGQVRECHGDLHLANVVWADAAPVLFDALEFDPQLRHTDVVGDAAFAFMDLLAAGRPRLAWRFASAWLEAGGQHDGLPLLAWWGVHRAAVRAKVALLSPTAAAAAGALPTGLQRYLAVALGLAASARRAPLLVLTCGLSGSGKSRVAAALAERLGGIRLRSDVERKRLFGLAPTTRGGPALYSAEAGARTYSRLQQLAQGALAAGVPVVVDAASLRHSERAAMQAVALACGAPFRLLLCQAPPAVLAQRVGARLASAQDASDATPALLGLQQQWVQWPGADEAPHTWRLDTDVPWQTVLARLEALPTAADAAAEPGRPDSA